MVKNTPARREAVALLAVLALAGCTASTTKYESLRRASVVHAAMSLRTPLASGELSQAPWADTSELSLDALIDVALGRNPTLASLQASWRAAVERYPQVTALDDPQLGYAVAPTTIGSDTSAFGQRLEFSQHFPWPGKLRLRGEAALSTAEAAGDHVEDARQRLVRGVTEAFYTYQFVHRAIDINQTNQGLLAEFQRIAVGRYAAGLVSKSDALQAEVERQHLVHRGIALERERAVTQARLNTLLNLPPKRPLPQPPREIPQPTVVPAVALLEGVAMETRPELQALAHSIDARSSEVALASREFYPDLSLNAGYNSLWEDSDKRTLVGIAINVPLQLERRRAALSQARAEERRAEARLEEARAKVLLEVSEAYDALVETRHVARLYSSSILPAARESLETARVGYEAGSNDFLTLVATEKALHLAELTYEQALARYQQGLARLAFSVGKPLDALEETR